MALKASGEGKSSQWAEFQAVYLINTLSGRREPEVCCYINHVQWLPTTKPVLTSVNGPVTKFISIKPF